MLNTEVEESLQHLETHFTAAAPLVGVFREVSDLQQVALYKDDIFTVMFARSCEFPADITVGLGNVEGWVSDDKMRMSIFFEPLEAFIASHDAAGNDQEKGIKSFIDIESGWDIDIGRGSTEKLLDFTTVVTPIERELELTDPRVRWALKVMDKVGVLMVKHIDNYGLPPAPPITSETLKMVMSKMRQRRPRI